MENFIITESERGNKIVFTEKANIQNINEIKEQFLLLKKRGIDIEIEVKNDTEIDFVFLQLIISFIKSTNQNISISSDSIKLLQIAKNIGLNRIHMKKNDNTTIQNIFPGSLS